jgi:hypothetical protein
VASPGGGGVTFEFRGERELARKLVALAKKAEARIGPALYRQGHRIMTRSKEEFVPVDLGTLRASGTVGEPEGLGIDTSLRLSYGSAATPYALAVHETHSRHDPPSWKAHKGPINFVTGGSKYLEKPFLEAVPTLIRDLARDLDVELS